MSLKTPLAGWLADAPFTRIMISGPDAATFLHGRLTSDVLGLQVGQGHPTALLDRKARLLAYGTLLRTEAEGFELWVHRELAEISLSELRKFHITETLTISLNEADRVLWLLSLPVIDAVFSDRALWLAAMPMNHHALEENGSEKGLRVVSRPFVAFGSSPAVGVLVSGNHETLTDLSNRLAALLPEACWPQDRYAAYRREIGLLLPGSELPDDVLLPETGLEHWTVNEDKGCYLGQETVARVKIYGRLQRMLGGVLLGRLAPDAPCPPAGSRLVLPDGSPAGTLCLAFTGEIRKLPAEQNPVGQNTHEQLMLGAALLTPSARQPSQSLQITDFPEISAKVAHFPLTQPALMADQAANALVEQASKQFVAGDLAQAESMLHQALRLNPLCGDAYESLGVMLGRQDRYEEAIALMHQLKIVDPSCVMAHTNLSVFYQKLGRIEDAETEKAKATTLAFQNAMRDKLASQKALAKPQEAQTQKASENASKNTQNDVQNAPKTPENSLEKLRERLHLFEQALAFAPNDKLALQGKASVLLQIIDVLKTQTVSEDADEVTARCQEGLIIATQLNDPKLALRFRRYTELTFGK